MANLINVIQLVLKAMHCFVSFLSKILNYYSIGPYFSFLQIVVRICYNFSYSKRNSVQSIAFKPLIFQFPSRKLGVKHKIRSKCYPGKLDIFALERVFERRPYFIYDGFI